MSETLALNMGTFEAINSHQEMLTIDGGASAAQYIAFAVAGFMIGSCVVLMLNPATSYIGMVTTASCIDYIDSMLQIAIYG